jgi:hypothetical protein
LCGIPQKNNMNKFSCYIYLLGLGLILTFSSCAEIKDINGIWIGNYPKRSFFESNVGNHILTSPKILDLTNKETAIIKFFNEESTEINWSISGEILTLDSIPYRIVSFSKDSILFSSYLTPGDSIKAEYEFVDIWDGDSVFIVHETEDLYYLTRINETKIYNSKEDISNHIKNLMWHNSNSIIDSSGKLNWIEFHNNGVAIYNRNYGNNSLNYIDDECWGIEKYKDYAFILFYKDWYRQNGTQDYVYQLTNIGKGELILEVGEKKNNRFISKSAAKNNNNNIKSILNGNWISLNDTNNYYGIHAEGYLKYGIAERYSDTIMFEFIGDSLIVNIKNVETDIYKWRLNSDNTILITEEKLDFDGITSFHTDYFLIKNITANSFDLEIINNLRETRTSTRPNQVILNETQKFRKIN